ncbi:something about silencing, SAS, complex subunit 4-domain-containing protein [Myxozyma melibiosi]|uniref:Something about silencing, SAS, complex subunit 4-domain-containing protein n=1 Tax=Myxozyma melibiosi TaxID=54550 RepID=A0ABR1F1D3_9ASCO
MAPAADLAADCIPQQQQQQQQQQQVDNRPPAARGGSSCADDGEQLKHKKPQPVARPERSHRSRHSIGGGGDLGGDLHTKDPNENLFWFENLDVSDPLDYSAPLPLVDVAFPTDPPTEPTTAPPPTPVPPKTSRPLSPASLKSLRGSSTISTRIRTDPLSDPKFHAAHRRGEREERHYQNFERDKVMYEKLRFERQLDRLNGHDWAKVVMSMTPVVDARDEGELGIKRDRLVAELSAVLRKFDRWKEQEKRRKSLADHSQGDDTDFEARRQRLEERKAIFRCIVGPDKSSSRTSTTTATTTPTTTTHPRGRPKKATRHPKKTDHDRSSPPPPPKRARVKKEHPPKPLFSKYKYHSPRAGPLAFGQPIPRMTYEPFEIPASWIEARQRLGKSAFEDTSDEQVKTSDDVDDNAL